MESILIVQSRKARKLEAIDVDRSRFPGVKHCWHASSQMESVRIIRKYKPELVILDVSTASGMDFGLFEETKEQQYQKIILCDTPNYVLKVLRFGIDDYLLKPAGAAEIEAAIERLLFRGNGYSIQQLYNSRRSQNLVKVTTAFIPTTQGILTVESCDVIRVQDMGEYRHIYRSRGREALAEWPIARLSTTLAGPDFVMIGQDQIINIDQIASIRKRGDRHFALMNDGHVVRIPITLEERILQNRPVATLRQQELFPKEGDQ
jgi:DNA-binding LytR/AlgR family response regulator